MIEFKTMRYDSYLPVILMGFAGLAGWYLNSPAEAMLVGFGVTLLRGRPLEEELHLAAKWLLQIAVIFLGYGLSLHTVLGVGMDSFWITATSIPITLLLGLLLGRCFKLDRPLSILISGGTAICGGSAIAALAPAIGAPLGQAGIALTVVFLLNGAGLIVFPAIGHLLGMSQTSFGLWSALAIHDTSSVVGAASIFGPLALSIGTTVKLTRALWIVPIACIAPLLGTGGHIRKWRSVFPFFLVGFIVAAATHSVAPEADYLWQTLVQTGRKLMLVSLFLIGLGLSWRDLRSAGLRPMFAGILLWVGVSVLSLALIHSGLWSITPP